MERSQSHTEYTFDDEQAPAAGLTGLSGRWRQTSRNAKLQGLGESSLCAGVSSSTSVPDFLSPHTSTPMISSRGASPAFDAGLRERQEKMGVQWRLRNKNPFYDHPQFRQYRTRQEQKEEKDGQKWPPILEDPFLDALLLIPDMGRSKYFMHGSLYGRNMIISTYVWMAYCTALPPRVNPNPVNKRDRKAISSHIQVLKNFFKEHRFFHFFFPTKDEEQRRVAREDSRTVESLSLKTNPVLVALSEGRFPDVRPNYEYFAHLLEQNSTVSIRPKTCWVYVSSQDALGSDEKVTSHNADLMGVSPYYPHLTAGETLGATHGLDAGAPLHEYTNIVSQTYSGPVKEITKQWETSFPELYEFLDLPEPQDEDSLTILEMHVTLELHKKHFPLGSELNGLIEMTISQSLLQNHQWKCVTRLVRPRELRADPDDGNIIFEHTDEVDVQFTHQVGCDDPEGGCDCMTKPRHDIRVPFPAAEWAAMLTNCASYPESRPQDEGRRRRSPGIKVENDDEGGDLPEPTQRELLSRIGMFQELWSSPPGANESSEWTRRAVVFWKFRDVNQYNTKKKKWVAEAPTTQWRFLTVNDPTSEYHMRNAYVPRVPTDLLSAPPEGMFVSPQQAFQDHLIPGDDFMTWNVNASVSNHVRSASVPAGSFDLEDIPGGGLSRSITIPNSFSSNLSSLESSHRDFGQQLSLLHSSCPSTASHDGSFVDDVAAPTDFLADNLTMVSSGLMYDQECYPALQSWETDIKGWAPTSEFEASLPPEGERTSEWGSGKEGWMGEEEWAPQLHMSLRPEWDEVGEMAGMGAQHCVSGGMGDVRAGRGGTMSEMGLGRVLGKRGREVTEVERPGRRARRVVGRA
ncbi:uncharacterized protein DNG_05021 [Cephalotrichum gorgonifer]|uniref:TEA domain-containing protein n=1 Tax=Cephalotrichum gorgonifer TaxID=2041049 RepID=A0AAE8MZP4_9PEZI|nr:uncharacterized protein DNG_05021 [Cephalotrichum gorgonifer]